MRLFVWLFKANFPMRGQTLLSRRREGVLPLPPRKRSRTPCPSAAPFGETRWGSRSDGHGVGRQTPLLGTGLGCCYCLATAERRRQGQPRSLGYPVWPWEPEAPLCSPGWSGAWGQAPPTPGHREEVKLGGRQGGQPRFATRPLRRPALLQWEILSASRDAPRAGRKASVVSRPGLPADTRPKDTRMREGFGRDV